MDGESSKDLDMIEEKLIIAPVLLLPNIEKTFKLKCDAYGVGIGVVLMLKRQPIDYFKTKLQGTTLFYFVYDK